MISIVDKNGDGKISYSEFRVMLGRYIVYVPYTIVRMSGRVFVV